MAESKKIQLDTVLVYVPFENHPKTTENDISIKLTKKEKKDILNEFFPRSRYISDTMQVAWVKPELNKIFGFIHVEERSDDLRQSAGCLQKQ